MLLKKYQTGGKVGKAGSYKKTDLWRKEPYKKGDLHKSMKKYNEFMGKIKYGG